jgi:ADP-dependent phosphofructokinase/glucokinase
MNIPVPLDGITLEVGTSDDGVPLNLMDWLKYKFVLCHPAVASSKQLSEANLNYTFYIEDMQEEIKAANKKVTAQKEAYKEFIKLSEDEDKMDAILKVMAPFMGEGVSNLKSLKTKDEKENKLDTYLKKNPSLFTELCKDKDLEVKAEIESMIDAQILTKVGNKIIYGSEPIGNNINEAIAYLKASSNSEVYTIMKARHEQLGGAPTKLKSKKEKINAD